MIIYSLLKLKCTRTEKHLCPSISLLTDSSALYMKIKKNYQLIFEHFLFKTSLTLFWLNYLFYLSSDISVFILIWSEKIIYFQTTFSWELTDEKWLIVLIKSYLKLMSVSGEPVRMNSAFKDKQVSETPSNQHFYGLQLSQGKVKIIFIVSKKNINRSQKIC